MTKCPMCGYDEAPAASMHQNKFSTYVHPDTKERVTINANDKEFTTKPTDPSTKAVIYIREDVWLERNPKDTTPPTPSAPNPTEIKEAPKVSVFGKPTPPIPQPNVKQ